MGCNTKPRLKYVGGIRQLRPSWLMRDTFSQSGMIVSGPVHVDTQEPANDARKLANAFAQH